MKILRAWIAPFPDSIGRKSGLSKIAMRVPKVEDNRFSLNLEKHISFPELIKKGEVHYLLGLIEDESLLVLKEAIEEYFRKEYPNGRD